MRSHTRTRAPPIMQPVSMSTSFLIITALSYILSFLVINPLMDTNMRSTNIRAVIILYGYVQFVLGFSSCLALFKIQQARATCQEPRQ